MIASLVVATLATACAAHANRKNVAGAKHEIDDIEIEGVERFDDDEILDHLYMCESSWIPFSEDCFFNEGYIPVDTQRIVELYRSYGYFHAEVTEIRQVPRGGRSDEVDIVVVVREGEPVLISRVSFHWLSEPGPDSGWGFDRSEVEAKARVAAPHPLEIVALDNAAARMRQDLQGRGYPLATAAHSAVVDLGRLAAEVRFSITVGARADIGKIRIVGLEAVPEYLVQREIDFAGGERFSPALLTRMERAVFAMDVFSPVTVLADREVGADGRIGITVTVSESEPQLVKIGVGLGLEPTRWEERVTGLYSHHDLFGQLTRFELRIKAGYAELPNPFKVVEHGPVLKIEPRLQKKGWIEKRLVWTMAPAFELGIQEGYQFYSPSTRLAISRMFFERLDVQLSHNLSFVDFFDVSPTLEANRSILGLDYRDPYLLVWVEVSSDLYLTDRVVDPRNGVVLGARYAVAGGALGGDYDFQKVVPRLRAYWKIAPRLQLAVQAETGLIFPYGDRPAAPFDMKFYLGGSDTVRGWGLRRLSPKTELCPDDGDCRSIPIGGYTMALGNLELRVRTWGKLYVVGFVDAGDVRAGRAEYDFTQLNYAAGGGLRYDSPFGKIRLDVGVRLNETQLSRGEDRWAFHLGLGEAF
jgi:outer membrane protein assembly factor BamA